MEELWSRAESLLGPVHCLVNNAGVTIVTMIMMTVIIMTFFMRMILGPGQQCRDDHDDDHEDDLFR